MHFQENSEDFMNNIRHTAGYTKTAVTIKEAAQIFELPTSVILDLEEKGFLAPNAATAGKQERYYVDEIKQAIIAKADSVNNFSIIVHAHNLKKDADWENWFTLLFKRYAGLHPKAMADIVLSHLKETLPDVLLRAGTIKLPGLGIIDMKEYASRSVYVDAHKAHKRIPGRKRPLFKPSKHLIISEESSNDDNA